MLQRRLWHSCQRGRWGERTYRTTAASSSRNVGHTEDTSWNFLHLSHRISLHWNNPNKHRNWVQVKANILLKFHITLYIGHASAATYVIFWWRTFNRASCREWFHILLSLKDRQHFKIYNYKNFLLRRYERLYEFHLNTI